MNRKFRVMVIDDEETARKLIKALVNWDELGMEVVGEAASGIEAINIIDDLKPDIVFVDISMPFMDGIEFTKIATDRYPNLIIIIFCVSNSFNNFLIILVVMFIPIAACNIHFILIFSIFYKCFVIGL